MTDEKNIFKYLFTTYYAKVHSYALKMTALDWVADEIAQNVFYKIWLHRDTIFEMTSRSDANIKGYIFMMTRNEVMDWWRSRDQIIKHQEQFIKEFFYETGIEKQLDMQNGLRLVERIVNSFPKTRKKVFVLSRYKHLSNSEIASFLGISKRTVEKHISLSLQQLRNELMSFLV